MHPQNVDASGQQTRSIQKVNLMMKTITISEQEYLNMQQTIRELRTKIALLQDQEFLKKLAFAYHYFYQEKSNGSTQTRISLKRGSAKDIITYIADDFDAPLDDFKEYMS